MDATNPAAAPAALVDCMRRLAAAGLSRGSSGNASARCARGMLITATGLPPERMAPEDAVELDLNGRVLAGRLRPSSEWPMHAAIYRARPDAQAIVHCHSRHATALACCGRDIPAFHYMVAVAGGDSIRCSPYALFGSDALAGHAVAALHERRACLLGNHGQIALGDSLEVALALAIEVEELAAQYCAALAIGEPHLLDGAQMRKVIERFAGYGQPQRRDGP
jgi:L-fuculose-phosphate aldolase